MIQRAENLEKREAVLFGGPGMLHSTVLLQKEQFAGKGRLFNFCVLHPGEAIGKHTHKGDFEAYYILKGEGLYDDNGTETTVHAGDLTLCLDGEAHALLNTGQEDLELMALVLYS